MSTFWNFTKSNFDLWTFWVFCHFEFWTIRSDVISTFGHFVKSHFNLCAFSTNFTSTFEILFLGYFAQRTFRGFFLCLSTSHFSTFCCFDLWTFYQKSVRPLDISYQCLFELWTFRIKAFCLFDSRLFRALDISPIVISTYWRFASMSCRPSNILFLVISIHCVFGLMLFSCHFLPSYFIHYVVGIEHGIWNRTERRVILYTYVKTTYHFGSHLFYPSFFKEHPYMPI